MREHGRGTGPEALPAVLLPAPTPARRRVALMLLAEAAAAAGGRVEELPGAVLLVGAEAGRMARLRDLLDRVMGGAGSASWPGPAPADPAALDRWLARLDPLLVARGTAGWRDGAAVPEFLRLGVARGALARLLGPAAAALPAALRARRAALAGHGALMEVEGLDAGALALIDPAALPVDLVRLDWSPALASADLAGLDPAHVILAGAHGPEARGWARRQGIALVEAEGTAPP